MGVNGNVGQIQVLERGLNLTEGIVKAVDKGTIELLYKGIVVMIFPYRVLLSLTKLILYLLDLSLLVLKYFLQRLSLRLRLL